MKTVGIFPDANNARTHTHDYSRPKMNFKLRSGLSNTLAKNNIVYKVLWADPVISPQRLKLKWQLKTEKADET